MANQIEIDVPEGLDGERLDKVVASVLGVSRARASVVVEAGAEIDGRPAKASDRVRSGSVVTCSEAVESVALEPEPIDFEVLYEDEAVVVVDKQPGLVVHPGSGQTVGTLAAGLLYRYPEIEGIGDGRRWGLIHRLDKDTSGAILVARTDEAFRRLKEELGAREIERTYTALVEGRMGAPTGSIDAPIGRDSILPLRRTVAHGGKMAITHFEVEHWYDASDCSLLTVRLETGRTHQIRVHLSAIDHPVVGDWTYGSSRRDLVPPRTCLHASSLAFTNPSSGERVTVDAPLPADLAALLDRL